MEKYKKNTDFPAGNPDNRNSPIDNCDSFNRSG